jgi:hypothetical protein
VRLKEPGHKHRYYGFGEVGSPEPRCPLRWAYRGWTLTRHGAGGDVIAITEVRVGVLALIEMA